MDRIHVFISGHVQGVFFRAHTQEEATRLKLTGWVRNIEDGEVEVVAEGEKTALEKLIAWCHKGPPTARVDNVQVTWKKAEQALQLQNFTIKY